MQYLKSIGPHLASAIVGEISAITYISIVYGSRLDALDHDVGLIDDRAKLMVQVDAEKARRCISASGLWEDARKHGESDAVGDLEETMHGWGCAEVFDAYREVR